MDEAESAVREMTDEKARVAVIGPAGENLVPLVTITIDSDSDQTRAGVAETVKAIQDERAAAYSLVVCDFAPYEQERTLTCLRHVTGWDITEEEYLAAGERTWNHTRLFNARKAGVSRKDDTLPPRMLEDPSPCRPRGNRRFPSGGGSWTGCSTSTTN